MGLGEPEAAGLGQYHAPLQRRQGMVCGFLLDFQRVELGSRPPPQDSQCWSPETLNRGKGVSKCHTSAQDMQPWTLHSVLAAGCDCMPVVDSSGWGSPGRGAVRQTPVYPRECGLS